MPASTTRGWSWSTRSIRARAAPTSRCARRSSTLAATMAGGAQRLLRATTVRAIVHAAGPWVCDVLGAVSHAPVKAKVRHVTDSHIVVPRVHAEPHAYILQNADNRIVFIIPYHDHYSLIGTTDIQVDAFEHPHISD